MKILVTGISGMIGSAVGRHLRENGHEISVLTRNSHTGTSATLYHWDPIKGILDDRALIGIDGMIHLAGENIAQGRWTSRRKNALIQSRVESTKLLVAAIKNSPTPPSWIISASAIGIYGDCGDTITDESTLPAPDFLGNLATMWEGALQPLQESSTRVIALRFGLVLTPDGGALKSMLPIFKLGGGAVLGSGNQYVSWISLRDVVRSIEWLIHHPHLKGPINGVSPNPITFNEFAKTLGKILRRPVFLKIPPFLVKLLFGEMGKATLLTSCRTHPTVLLKSGFEFKDSTLKSALNNQLIQQTPLG